MDNFLLVPWFIFWTIIISQFGLMEPFKHKNVQGQEIVQSRDAVIQDAATENARIAKLEKEASKIRSAYSKALKDCTGRSFDGSEGKSAGASYDYANYIFNTYDKACYVTKMSGIVDGDYTYSFSVAYTIDLPDWSLVYRK
ncbi:hypothetical protein AO073_23970 [Pseudomonas syringae ICMP 11293]|uniref:hypothetical protein n=1 Tax=Pseudomonas syringae TaxID=317 RepID=UPI0007312A78|nr:hypothetical protein [Pseudomonas syringae]KTB89994.1 hypothetical protein AO073_23970 [Pseudomonas syringae ICMP 11293]